MSETIDDLLDTLRSQDGVELRLQVGAIPQYVSAGGDVTSKGLKFTQQDLVFLMSPIMPTEVRRQLAVQPKIEFEYTARNGIYDIVISRAGGTLSATTTLREALVPFNPNISAEIIDPYSLLDESFGGGLGTGDIYEDDAGGQAAPQPAEAPPPPPVSLRFPIDRLFYGMFEAKASDLHLSVGSPPLIRKDGRMAPLDGGDAPLTPESIEELLMPILPQKNREEFKQRNDSDSAYEIEGLARFRCNVFRDRKGMGAVFRVIPSKILTAEQLGLSPYILKLCQLTKGLVLVTGPTGSGKSTTLCALIDYVNSTRDDHIITIEDPVEFVHENRRCLINQREVHSHTKSFKNALRAALREDPDIILVGEMRDLETISIAIETAETGHLVFGTLHTTTAASTVDRIIDQFPTDRQAQIRVMLSESLRGVISQTLCRKVGGGRIAALEVLIVNSAISNLIREGKTFQIPSMMQTGRGIGMVTLNDALLEFVKSGIVEPYEAYAKSVDKTGFEALLKRADIDTGFMSGSGAHT